MSQGCWGRWQLRAALFSTTAAALCLGAAGAQAATVQVGSTLSGNFVPTGFDGSVLTLVQESFAQPGGNLTSPVDGTVVSYRVVASDGTFAIQILRPSGSGAQSIASSAPSHVTSTGISPPIATNLAIKAGDSVGIRNFDGSELLGAIDNGSRYSFWDPPLADGVGPRDPVETVAQYELGMAATVRYCQVPKLKGKSPKKARKALAAADCSIGKTKKTKKVRKKKKVLSQSVAPGTSISDTTPVNLKVSRQG